MRFFASGPGEVGFLAVGQVATGVIAIGQVARGGLAIGQGAIGLVAIGQGAVGVFYATAMLGVAGRKGWGLVVPLIPSVGAPRVPPAATPLAVLTTGGPEASGWVAVALGRDALGIGFFEGGQRLPIKIDRRLQTAATNLLAKAPTSVFAFTRCEAGRFVSDRIVYVPERPYRRKGFFALAGAQVAALIGLGIAFWPMAGNDFLASSRATSAAEHHPAPPAPPAPHPRPPAPSRSGH